MVDRLTPGTTGAATPVTGSAAAPGATGTVGLGRVELLLLPERLNNLSRPIVVTGQITGQNADGTVGLRTQFGEIRLNSAVALPTDRPLTLQIPAGNPPRDAVAVTDSAPPTASPSLSAAASNASALKATLAATPSLAQVLAATPSDKAPPVSPTQTAAPATNLASLPAAPLTTGTRLTALILTQELGSVVRSLAPAAAAPLPQTTNPAAPLPAAPAPGATPSGSGLAAALSQASGQASGVPVVSTLLASGNPTPVLPESSARPAGAPPLISQPPATVSAAATTAAQGQVAAPQALPTESAQISTTPAPVLATPQFSVLERNARPVHLVVASAETPQALSATVIGKTEADLPLVRIGNQTAVLLSRAPVTEGQQLFLATPTISPQNLPPAALALFQGRDWPALKEAIASLDQNDTAAAFRLRDVIPQNGPGLRAQLGLFIAAARAGKLSSWLGGDTVDSIEHKSGSALARVLSDDLARIGQQSQAQAQDGWRTTTLPFLADGMLQRLDLHVKADDHGADTLDPANRPRRFIVETELTNLGPLQVDGLMKGRSLDLILRSREALPADLQAELYAAHEATMNASGFTGALVFQFGARADWVRLQPAKI